MTMVPGCVFIKQMIDAGLLPPRCKKVVLRASVDSAITIEYECLAGKELIEFNVAKQIIKSQGDNK